ncbi:hypothetical protein ABQE62_07170 [Mycolicibacterium fortuitum]
MRPEVWQVTICHGAMVLITGDTGTGKSSVLRASIEEYPATVVAPPVEICLYESGALQSAILDALAGALAIAQPGQKRWRELARRLRHATAEAAIEVGKGLAEAAVEEVVQLAKAKLGENVGQGLLKFLKTFTSNDGQDLRRALRTQSDASIVRLLVRMADEVAAVAGRDIVISLDEGNRLSDEDQRVLASLAAKPAERARVVVAWSTAETESRPGLARLRAIPDVDEVEVGGLSQDDVDRWLRDRRLGEHTDEVYRLTAGYPLLVEGLVAHLVSGGNLEGYSAPTLFNDVMRDALSRLPADAHRVARRLSAFTYPLPERDIPGFLGVDAVDWGVLREALERERVFSVRYPDGAWFHEARRIFLWDNVLTAAERDQVGQAAYTELLDRHGHDDAAGGVGRFRQIAELASYAVGSRAQNSGLRAVLELNDPELAVLAAAIELQTAGTEGSHTPADQVVVHAHTAFATTRIAALEALPVLRNQGIVNLEELPRQSDDRTDTVVEVALDHESLVVARGRIHTKLGKPAVPQLATHVVHAHLERVRLESYAVITQAGHADALEVIIRANQLRGPAFVRPVGDPLLVAWLRFGEQPVTIAAVFNSPAQRAIAERAVANLSASSFGRRLVVDRTLSDPSQTLPSWRFFRAVWFASGLSVSANASGNFWLDLSEALPMAEFAQRQVDLLDLLRTATSPVEREAYGLALPTGVAIARRDTTEFRLDVRGSAHVYLMDFDEVEHILAAEPLVSARLELALDLPPFVTTQTLTTQTWTGQRVQDPVVEMFGRLHAMAVRFNDRQPRTRVHLDRRSLTSQLAAANVRDQQMATQLSEKITIGDRRGHRPTRALRLAIHTHGPAARPARRFALSAFPVGDPEDVQVRYVTGDDLDTPEKMYQAAFGSDEEMTDPHGGMLPEVVAALLGHAENELEFVDK